MNDLIDFCYSISKFAYQFVTDLKFRICCRILSRYWAMTTNVEFWSNN